MTKYTPPEPGTSGHPLTAQWGNPPTKQEIDLQHAMRTRNISPDEFVEEIKTPRNSKGEPHSDRLPCGHYSGTDAHLFACVHPAMHAAARAKGTYYK